MSRRALGDRFRRRRRICSRLLHWSWIRRIILYFPVLKMRIFTFGLCLVYCRFHPLRLRLLVRPCRRPIPRSVHSPTTLVQLHALLSATARAGITLPCRAPRTLQLWFGSIELESRSVHTSSRSPLYPSRSTRQIEPCTLATRTAAYR